MIATLDSKRKIKDGIFQLGADLAGGVATAFQHFWRFMYTTCIKKVYRDKIF